MSDQITLVLPARAVTQILYALSGEIGEERKLAEETKRLIRDQLVDVRVPAEDRLLAVRLERETHGASCYVGCEHDPGEGHSATGQARND